MPLLTGELGERAQAAVQAIHDAAQSRAPTDRTDPTLASGHAGAALLSAYLGDGNAAVTHMDLALDAAATGALDPSLFGGTTGVAWVAAHLHREFPALASGDPVAGFDAALADAWRTGVQPASYDLISGSVGQGVYLLERLPRAVPRETLEVLVRSLAERGVRDGEGLTWHTPPEGLPPWQRETSPQGHYDLGLAHGVPGVMVLLARCCAAGVVPGEARRMLEDTVTWLRAQGDRGGRTRFPSWVAPGHERARSRVAWCYGDLSVAAGLLCAARCAGVAAWEDEALSLALAASGRDLDEGGVRDAGLCHGAAGIAHVLHRMYLSSGHGELAEAARRWFERTLAMGREHDDPGFLTGSAGIGLALLAAITDRAPSWDRTLLISDGERG